MDLKKSDKKIGFSLEEHIRYAYETFIQDIKDYKNREEPSPNKLWETFSPIYAALASSYPPATRIEREIWARDLILAYKKIDSIKTRLLEEIEFSQIIKNNSSPLDEL